MAIIHHITSRRIGQSNVATEIKAENKIPDEIADFISTIKTPMAKQKAVEALTKQQGFNGVFMKRYVWAINKIESVANIDYDKKRVNFDNGCFLAFSDITKTVVNFIEFERAKQ